jgi:hypothetical protein
MKYPSAYFIDLKYIVHKKPSQLIIAVLIKIRYACKNGYPVLSNRIANK